MELRQLTTENHPAAVAGFHEIGSAAAASFVLVRLTDFIEN
jgi:hypothetical protein